MIRTGKSIRHKGVKHHCETMQRATFFNINTVSHVIITRILGSRGSLVLDVMFSPLTAKKLNIDQVKRNSCSGVLQSTPFPGGVVGTVLSRDNNKMAD